MEFQIDYGLVANICAVAALMLANTLFRIALSVKIGDFDPHELGRGLVKYLITLLGVAAFYTAGEFCPEAGVEIAGEMVTIDTILNMVALSLIAVYTVKCFDNIKDIFRDTGVVLIERAQKAGKGL